MESFKKYAPRDLRKNIKSNKKNDEVYKNSIRSINIFNFTAKNITPELKKYDDLIEDFIISSGRPFNVANGNGLKYS